MELPNQGQRTRTNSETLRSINDRYTRRELINILTRFIDDSNDNQHYYHSNIRRLSESFINNGNSQYNIYRTAHDYSDNQRTFNTNNRRLTDSFLNLIAPQITELSRPQRVRQENTRNNRWTTTNYDQFPNTYNLFDNFYNTAIAAQMTNVVVRPTVEQINRACEFFFYDVSANQGVAIEDHCPISLEHFDNGDELCRIIGCTHLFHKNSIMGWFETNTRCPVCRYDIRDYTLLENDASNNTVESELIRDEDETQRQRQRQDIQQPREEVEQTRQDIQQQRETRETRETRERYERQDSHLTNTLRRIMNTPAMRNISSSIQTFINDELPPLNIDETSVAQLLYTFDIPILDISNARIFL